MVSYGNQPRSLKQRSTEGSESGEMPGLALQFQAAGHVSIPDSPCEVDAFRRGSNQS